MALTYPNINSQLNAGFQLRRNFSDLLNGVTDGSEAASGQIGEFSSINPAGNVSPGLTGAFATITSLSLTAGKWRIFGNGVMTPGTIVSPLRRVVAISLTTNAIDDQTKGNLDTLLSTDVANLTYQPVTRRINSASSFTVFLVGLIDYAVLGTAVWNTQSYLEATRIA